MSKRPLPHGTDFVVNMIFLGEVQCGIKRVNFAVASSAVVHMSKVIFIWEGLLRAVEFIWIHDCMIVFIINLFFFEDFKKQFL